jgi:hypothetical protein
MGFACNICIRDAKRTVWRIYRLVAAVYLYLGSALAGTYAHAEKNEAKIFNSDSCGDMCIARISLGALCAPSQAIVYGFNFEQTLAWIAAGFYFDIIHGIGNIVMSTLIYPLIKLLFRLERISVEKGQ